MKRITQILTVTFVLAFALTFPVQASSSKDHNMAGSSTKSMSSHSMDAAGIKFHESHIKGYHFTYELIDMREKVKDMPGMKDTHHLMVHIKDAEGNPVSSGRVGYLIKGPDGTDQKKMCMAMGGGFGSDVNLGAKGKYIIKTKLAAGDVKLMDEFEYEMK